MNDNVVALAPPEPDRVRELITELTEHDRRAAGRRDPDCTLCRIADLLDGNQPRVVGTTPGRLR